MRRLLPVVALPRLRRTGGRAAAAAARWPAPSSRPRRLARAAPPRSASSAPFGFRYQYLAGGVNTGQGWSTWNPDGTFVTLLRQESWAHRRIPVLTYYKLLQSSPTGGRRGATDLAHLADPALMAAYWNDVRLLFQRARGTRSRSSSTSSRTSGATSSSARTATTPRPSRRWCRTVCRRTPPGSRRSASRCATSSRRTSSSPTT